MSMKCKLKNTVAQIAKLVGAVRAGFVARYELMKISAAPAVLLADYSARLSEERDMLDAAVAGKDGEIGALLAERNHLREELATAKEKLAQLYGALNFRADAQHKIVLDDARRLRPEMAKARRRVKEIEGSIDYWLNDEAILQKGGALANVWKRLKAVEAERDRLRTIASDLAAAHYIIDPNIRSEKHREALKAYDAARAEGGAE